MESYYQLKYRINCHVDNSTVSSQQFLTFACHLGSFFMFTSSFYALFLVVKVSPRTMRSSVPYILNLHLWTMFCDFMFAIMLLPYFMLPLVVIKPLGLLQMIGTPPKIQLWLAFASLGGMCAAITTLFEYRHRSIVSGSRFVMRRKSTIFIYNLILYGYHINFGVPETLTMPENQLEAKLKLLETFPCPPPAFFDEDSVFVVQLDGRTLFNPHMYFTCFSLSCIVAFFGFHTLWHLLPQNNPLMSQSTRKFQRNFLISSAVQASIPTTVILVPNVYWNLTITFGFHSQEANNISVLILTLHGFAASIGIILLYTPYRNFTKNLFRRRKRIIMITPVYSTTFQHQYRSPTLVKDVLINDRVSSVSMTNLESGVRNNSRRRTA